MLPIVNSSMDFCERRNLSLPTGTFVAELGSKSKALLYET